MFSEHLQEILLFKRFPNFPGNEVTSGLAR